METDLRLTTLSIKKISIYSILPESLSGCLKAIVYTIGHISIALFCILCITGSPIETATVDAVVEPLINGVWFFILDQLWPQGPHFPKTCLYTVGHITLACLCIIYITGSELQYALIDAIVEPLINALWYYILHHFWPTTTNSPILTQET